MVKKIYNYIMENNMLDGADTVVVGLSGGADSVCLLLVLQEIKKHFGVPANIVAVHVNHMIRGSEAQRDEQFAGRLCGKLGIEYVSRRMDIPAAAKRERLSEEEAGRIARYRIFGEIAQNQQKIRKAGVKIAVAHHKNDQAETVLMKLVRGSSIRGLAGMQPVRGNIIRPLLCVTRAEIEEYLETCGQPYVTDSTNEKTEYTRNRIRGELLPYLQEKLNPNITEQLSQLAHDAAETNAYLENQARELYSAAACSTEDGSIELSVRMLENAPPVLQKLVIRSAAESVTPTSKDIYRAHIEAAAGLLAQPAGKRVSLPGGASAVREYETVRFVKAGNEKNGNEKNENEKTQCSLFQVIEQDRLERIWNGEKYSVFVEQPVYMADRKQNCRVCAVFEAGNFEEIYGNNIYTKFFDYDRIKSNLVLRFRRPSDFFILDADGNRKLLKREFIDKKVPQEARSRVLLLADDESVLWAAGVRRSAAGLIGRQTGRILKVSIAPEWMKG